MRLQTEFFARDARQVARELLGKTLHRRLEEDVLAGVIVETEAYCATGPQDLACHGSKNRGRPTGRTAVMFGPPGFTYIYFNYGMHWLFNIVTGLPGEPSAVLVRAVAPLAGEERMAAHRRGRPRREWTNGPAKLTQALAIDQNLNEENLCTAGSVIWCEDAPTLARHQIATGPRIGLGRLPEPWVSIPWRYWIKDNPFVSAGSGRPGQGTRGSVRV